MKLVFSLVFFGALLQSNANATIETYSFNSGFQNGGVIPDGTTAGLSDTRTIGGSRDTITDVQVTLNIAGGYNGDLYAYLVHGSQMVVLLNRVGVNSSDAFGYADGGFNIHLANGGALGDIHNYGGGGIPTGTYAPDGRNIDPLSAAASFDAAGATDFSVFNGVNPNGAWTLFLADVVGGEGTPASLSSWSLEISAVPEPANVALGGFAVVFLLIGLGRSERVRKLLHSVRA